MKKIVFFLFCLSVVAVPFLSAEEEAREPVKSPSVQNFASGLKQVAYEAPKALVEGAVEEIPPKKSFFERMNEGIGQSLDHAVKGAYRVATLGQSELESYQVEEPRKGSDEVTKVKISLPGT